jgi:hypothetical protein
MSTDYSTADVTLSTVEEGEVRVNLGEKSDGSGFGAACSLWSSDGFIGCPNEQDDAGACQVIYLQDGNEKLGIAARDARYNDKVGALAEGDRAIISGCAARLLLKKASSSISLYTENQLDDDSSMVIAMDGSKGKIRIICGKSQIQIDNDGITLMSNGSILKLDANAITMMGKFAALATGGGCLGTIAGVPAPLGARSILAGPIGMTGVGSTGWSIAT